MSLYSPVNIYVTFHSAKFEYYAAIPLQICYKLCKRIMLPIQYESIYANICTYIKMRPSTCPLPKKYWIYVHMCQENSQQFLFIPFSQSVCQNVRFFTHAHTKWKILFSCIFCVILVSGWPAFNKTSHKWT